MEKKKKPYPEKKSRELSEVEKEEIRKHIKRGNDCICELAKRFNCSTSQVAGVKAALNRGKKVK